MGGIHFRINVAVDSKNIRATIVIDIDKHGPPSQIMRVEAEANVEDCCGERAIAIIAIERRGIVGKIRLENVGAAVVIVVSDSRTHAGLFASILIEGHAGLRGDVDEGSIFLVVIKNAGGAVAGHVDVGPAIVIVVESGNAEAIVAVRFFDAAGLAYVSELSTAEIVIKNIGR